MLTVLAMAMALQQAAGSPVVWEMPAPVVEPTPAREMANSDLPAWALADPFGWERSQCSPMIRRDPSLEACQARIRGDLHAALGDRLPAGLLPANTPVPCLATPGDDGTYPIQCGVPERRGTVVASAQAPDCRPRPTRQGGSVVFITECRNETRSDDEGGLSFRLFGKD
ncbi:MAG: hypothetical protein K2X25_07660 [Caulobacteraceae bacterium]|nr:hypothetical protein [Caulobacteraceae bacterium]